jgi:general secretion pathway protein K
MTAPAPEDADAGRRGFALILVLWALVLVSLIVAQLASTGRRETHIAGNLSAGAKAEAAADGAVYETIFRLLDASPEHWALDGKDRRLTLDDGAAVIRIESEAGKINPNTAPPALLGALLTTVGVDRNTAARLADAIVEWRGETFETPNGEAAALTDYQGAGMDHGPPAEPFQSIDELGRVIGMTPAVLAGLRPHLSLYQQGAPDPAFADPVVRAALQTLPTDPDGDTPHGSGLDAVTVTADIRLKSGGRFIRHAVVRLGAGAERGYVIYEWDGVPADQMQPENVVGRR